MRRIRVLWTLSITLMTAGTTMIAYALYASAWANNAVTYLLGSLLLVLYVIMQTVVAAYSNQRIHRR